MATSLICLTAFSVAIFMLSFYWLGIVAIARTAIRTLTDAVAALKNPTLDDYAREKAAQAAGIRLFRFAVSILIRSVATFLLASLPFLAADALGVITGDEALAFLARWDVIVVASVGTIAVWLVGGRFWQDR